MIAQELLDLIWWKLIDRNPACFWLGFGLSHTRFGVSVNFLQGSGLAFFAPGVDGDPESSRSTLLLSQVFVFVTVPVGTFTGQDVFSVTGWTAQGLILEWLAWGTVIGQAIGACEGQERDFGWQSLFPGFEFFAQPFSFGWISFSDGSDTSHTFVTDTLA